MTDTTSGTTQVAIIPADMVCFRVANPYHVNLSCPADVEYPSVNGLLETWFAKKTISASHAQLQELVTNTQQEALIAVQHMAYARRHYTNVAEGYRGLIQVCKEQGMDLDDKLPHAAEYLAIINGKAKVAAI
uniref:Uncharacterized protein n=1 Tax=Mycena chlorophos TaxID=658473 RepID=A0ABQ0LJG0_MYCCL|nr:predicted protein [Mycena chlorophos]